MCAHKNYLLFVITILYSSFVFGQLSFTNTNNGRVVDLTGINGRGLMKDKYAPDIEGTPFLNVNWDLAKLTLSNGKEIPAMKVKLNIESNEVYFLDSTGKEMIALDGLVKKLNFQNLFDKDSVRYQFKTGYPSINLQTDKSFYQVLAEGKIELLVRKYKYIREEKDLMSGEIKKEFIEITQTYLFANKTMMEFKKDKDAILLHMQDKEAVINQYLSVNKVSFKKMTDIIKLFNYYNSL